MRKKTGNFPNPRSDSALGNFSELEPVGACSHGEYTNALAQIVHRDICAADDAVTSAARCFDARGPKNAALPFRRARRRVSLYE